MGNQYRTSQTLLYKISNSEDDHSWEQFVKYYEGYIYVVIRSMGVRKDLVQDLLQDTLLKIWKALPNYDYREGECTFRTWLCLVIRSTVYNYFRKRSTKNDKKNVDYDATAHALNVITEPEINKIAELEWKSYVSNMAWKNVKNEFSDRVREVFEASINESDNQIIGERFGMSASSVRVYRSRVKKVLLREISRLDQELGEI